MMVLACHGALRTAARRDPVTGRGRGAKFGGHDALTVFSAEKLSGDGPLPGPDATAYARYVVCAAARLEIS